jgi:hypothetical protein
LVQALEADSECTWNLFSPVEGSWNEKQRRNYWQNVQKVSDQFRSKAFFMDFPSAAQVRVDELQHSG